MDRLAHRRKLTRLAPGRTKRLGMDPLINILIFLLVWGFAGTFLLLSFQRVALDAEWLLGLTVLLSGPFVWAAFALCYALPQRKTTRDKVKAARR